MQVGKDMYMIFHTVNAEKLAVFVLYYARNVLIQLCAMWLRNCGQTVCTKHNLIKDLAIRAHVRL